MSSVCVFVGNTYAEDLCEVAVNPGPAAKNAADRVLMGVPRPTAKKRENTNNVKERRKHVKKTLERRQNR